MTTFVGTYNFGPSFAPYGGVDPGPHLGPDLNGVNWLFVVGRHTGSDPDDFGGWVFGWLGSAFTTLPVYALKITGGHGVMSINPSSGNLLVSIADGPAVKLYRIEEAKFH